MTFASQTTQELMCVSHLFCLLCLHARVDLPLQQPVLHFHLQHI
jgi:hypothetical protein